MKKTFAMVLALALVSALCGMLFVSAEETNLAAGKSYTTTAIYETNGVQNWPDEEGKTLTDGVKAAADTGYTDAAWVGFNKQSADYDAEEGGDGAVTLIDLGAAADLSKVVFTAFGGGVDGINAPYWVNLYASSDNETFTFAGSLEIDPAEAVAGPNEYTVETDATAQYVKVCFYGYGWIFVDEIEVYGTAATGGDEPESSEPADEPESSEPEADAPEFVEIQLSHVNCYSWGTYFDMVTYGEGRNCSNLKTGAQTCEWWLAIKVDNVDGVYTVTQIEGNGEAKEMAASADGFVMYLYSGNENCPANYENGQKIQVGDIVYSHTFDWTVDAASETALGNIVFAPAGTELPSESTDDATSEESKPQTGDAGVLVFAVLAVVAIAGCATVVKARG